MDHIILLAQQISQEGKVPSIALLKARLPKNVPLPSIIQGLKLWKENPQKAVTVPAEADINESIENKHNTSFDALIDTKIKLALTPLIVEIDTLKNQIANLQKQLTIEDKK